MVGREADKGKADPARSEGGSKQVKPGGKEALWEAQPLKESEA